MQLDGGRERWDFNLLVSILHDAENEGKRTAKRKTGKGERPSLLPIFTIFFKKRSYSGQL